jgi:hypothetical protein
LDQVIPKVLEDQCHQVPPDFLLAQDLPKRQMDLLVLQDLPNLVDQMVPMVHPDLEDQSVLRAL